MAHHHALETLYDIGDKANKLPRWFERRHRERSWVPAILDAANELQRMSVAIANAFANHYEDMYQFSTNITGADCADLLKDLTPDVNRGRKGYTGGGLDRGKG
ncbi:hypothetical protein NDU88_006543 [Pleurodeles waltl]|uniref:Uncharacterized protein n=1 Tax=Pleurodeles waltl TaxID=8319 RepID=A0AAV7WEK9_PLEWA|nr:hypothetical protein NDU88_006543 [Pleurodeles waltl]